MKISGINKKIIKDIENSIHKKTEELNINASFEPKDFLIFGAVTDDNKNVLEIDIFSKIEVLLYNSDEKYDIKEFSDENSDFYDGEILAQNDLNAALRDNVFHKDLKINLHCALNEFNEVFPEQEGFELDSFIDVQTMKRKKQIEKELREDIKPNVTNSDEVRKMFSDLGYKQRNEPEMQMLKCQRLLGGGVVSHLIEHVGDLTHRLSENTFSETGDLDGTLQFVEPKVKRALITLKNGYGFLREHDDNLTSNYKAFKDVGNITDSFEEWNNKINDMLSDYSLKHSELPVYNEAQYYAREAAVELGKLNIEKTIEHLELLDDIIESGEYLKVVSKCEPNGYKPEVKKKKKQTKKNKI